MRPTRDQMLQWHADLTAQRSTCSRASVGVVVARDGRILVTGYNGAPAGMPHCNHDCNCHMRSGHSSLNSFCRANKPCTISVHAEANAIAYAARWGIALEGAELFTTMSPCLACAQIIVNAGIVRVVSGVHYRDTAGLDLLKNAGIALR